MSTSITPRVWGEISAHVHAARLRYFAQTRAAEVRRADGALAVVTGAFSNIENGIVCERADVQAEVAADLVGWIRERNVPASWISETVEAPDELAEALRSLGCREETAGVDMGAEIRAAPKVARLSGVRIEEVVSSTALEQWLDVAQTCQWFGREEHRERQRRLYTNVGLGADGPHRHWIAKRGEVPVGLATAFFADGAVLLENLAVVAAERRRGIGTALATRRLAAAHSVGCTLAVLAPTAHSRPFYARLGFTLTSSPPRRWWYLP
jgi:ElaA protein